MESFVQKILFGKQEFGVALQQDNLVSEANLWLF